MSYFPTSTGLGAVADDAAPVRALQAQVNRFGAALPVTGVLDLGTSQAAYTLVTQALIYLAAKSPNNASLRAQMVDASKNVASGPAWVQDHLLEATYLIRQYADAVGKPAAAGDLPLPLILGAAAFGALLLLRGRR